MKSLTRSHLPVCFLTVLCTLIPLVQRPSAQSRLPPAAGLALSGTQTAVTQTDANGAYSFDLAPSGSYSITPSKAGLVFTDPASIYPNLSQSFKTANFLAATAPAVTISGRLRNVNQRGLSGETVNLSGSSAASTTTDANGAYSFTVASGGSYDVEPADSRVSTWLPDNIRSYSNLTQSVSTADFEARFPTFTVTGVVKNSGGTTFPGVKVRLNGTNLTTKDYTTSSSGSYTSDQLNILGDYTFTPQEFTASSTTYNSFTPSNKSFVSILTCPTVPGASCSSFDYLGIDFTAIAAVKSNQTITFNALADKSFGDAPFNVSATSSSGLPVSFSILSGPATISANTITITGVGAVTVRAAQAGNANFNAATPVDRTFNVLKAFQSINFNFLADKTFGDAPFTVTATASSGLPVSFSIVSGPATISVNTITLTDIGVVTVRAAQAGNSNYNAATPVDRSFTVAAPTFQPVVLTTDQVEIKTWNTGGRTYAYLKLLFPNAGYRVTNWGLAVRSGNDFSADAAVEKYTGASIQAVTTTAQIYDLGPLTNSTYNFNFKTSGTLAKTLQFIISSTVPPPNPIDDARQFVKQQYRDFLNREADQAGEDFWTDNITKCNDPARRPPGQTVEQCTLRQRETTSGAFFMSPEFQYTGYYVYRMYVGALGRPPKLSEFVSDAQFVGNGIIVNGQLSGAQINQNKAAFAAQFANCVDATKSRCAEFKAIYDKLSDLNYVDKLFLTTGVNASASDRQALLLELNSNPSTGRATVLQKVVDGINVISEGNQQFTTSYGQAFYNSELNRAFVQLEYFGYMKRDPDDAGYAFWLAKLNQFGGNFVNAEMVLAFISSPEYRARFGQP